MFQILKKSLSFKPPKNITESRLLWSHTCGGRIVLNALFSHLQGQKKICAIVEVCSFKIEELADNVLFCIPLICGFPRKINVICLYCYCYVSNNNTAMTMFVVDSTSRAVKCSIFHHLGEG